ncbi:MAG: M3 family oligoendopeptidase [Anaerolineae bacterium]
MLASLPTQATDILDYTWADIAPHAEAFRQRDITADTLDSFLRDLTAFLRLIGEMGSRIYVATTENTQDEVAKRRFMTLIQEIQPQMSRFENDMNLKLLNSGLEPANYYPVMRYIRKQVEIFREENLPLISQVAELENRFNEIIGAQTVEFDGETRTLVQMNLLQFSPDRALRERAFRAVHARRLQDREALNDLWVQMFKLRQQIARNAGFDNFLEYQWMNYGRFDYTIEDTRRFHEAIEQVVVPAVNRLNEKRRRALGLDVLKQWDVLVDTYNREPLKPFRTGAELTAGAQRIFDAVDPELGGFFRIMADEGYLDLENRPNKAPGGYCTSFPQVQRSYIFMNAVGLHDDLQTMLHEGGHAFHNFEAFHHPYVGQHHAPIEFCEVASMGMELFAQPYLVAERGGFYSAKDAARASIEHLENMLVFWPYMAVVDAFQQWAYTSGDAALDPANCDAKWEELWHRFKQGVDYSEPAEWAKLGWHRKLHIFTVPLYYIEYGIAQLGAAQVWANSLQDHAGALKAYRRALALGNTRTLPELFEAAGAKLSFDADTLGRMVELIESKIAEFEAV